MSNYTKATNFASKDNLPVGDANKKVKGAEIDVEFNAIADAIATKPDKASPAFTGTPTAPTAAAGTNTTQIATTGFVTGAVSDAQASPAFTGTPTAPTAVTGTDTTQLATTAFVQQEITSNAFSVADGSITTAKLAADAVTSAKLADNAVGSEHIAADAVGASELNVSGNGTSGQYLQSDGDGTFSWETAVEVYTPTVGSNSVSTSGFSRGSYVFGGSTSNTPSFTVASGEVWLLTSNLVSSGSLLFFTHDSSTQLEPNGFVGEGTYYFRGKSTIGTDNDVTRSVSWHAWRVK